MTAQPGTPEYAQQLAKECHVLKVELGALRGIASQRAAGDLAQIVIEYSKLMQSDAGQALGADIDAYNRKVAAHREVVQRTQQAKANARAAAKVQAASCGTCFTVHAGDCY